MVGWMAYMVLVLRVVGGRVVVMRSAGLAAGPTSDLGVMGVLEVALDAALPVLSELEDDVRVLVHGCPSRYAAALRPWHGWHGWHGIGRDGAAGKQIGDVESGDGEPEAQATSAGRMPAGARSAPPAMVSVTQLVLIIGGTSFKLDGSSQS